MATKYYAVKKGNNPGIYCDWESCKKNVNGFKGAIYKSFKTKQEAEAFLDGECEKNKTFQEENYHSTEDEVFDEIKEKNEMIAYIDGSFENSLKVFSYAGTMFYENKKENFAFASKDPDLISMRNVSGEVKASMYVIEKAVKNKLDRIKIYYDYAGIENWANGNWQANNHLTQSYRDFAEDMRQKIEIEFVKVKSHTNIKFNEEVDKLAKQAIKDYALQEI